MNLKVLFALLTASIVFTALFLSCTNDSGASSSPPYINTTVYPPIKHNVGKNIETGEIFPEPYSARIEEAIKLTPWFGTRHTGWCGTGSDEGQRRFKEILASASFKELIPFLNHRAEYVRAAVHDILREKKNSWHKEIKDAYSNGNARIKLELLEYTDPKASVELRSGLLDEIIQNPDMRVFINDLRHIEISKIFKGKHFDGPLKPVNYPFDIVGFYTRLLEDHYAPDRGEAIRLLGYYGSDSARAIPALVELMKLDNVKDVDADGFGNFFHSQKALTALTIGQIGIRDENAVAELIKLRENNLSISSYAAFALYKLDGNKQEQLDFLIKNLNSQSEVNYLQSLVESLGYIGPDAKDAIPKMTELLTHEDSGVRWITDMALRNIEGAEALIKRHIENLKNDNPDVRNDAIDALSEYQDEKLVKDALHDIIQNDKDLSVVYSACLLIEDSTNPDENLLLDGYIRILELCDRESYSCIEVVSKIAGMRMKAKRAIPAMINFLGTDPDAYVESTIDAIFAIGGDFDSVVERISEVIKGEDSSAKIHVIYALGKLDKPAVNALPALYDEFVKSSRILTSGHESKPYNSQIASSSAISAILNSALKNSVEVPSDILLAITSLKDKNLSDLAFKLLRKSDKQNVNLTENLTTQILSDDEYVRKLALDKIGEMGEDGLQMVPLMRKNLKDEEIDAAIGKIVLSLKKGHKYDQELLLQSIETQRGVDQKRVEKILELGVPEDLVMIRLADIADSMKDSNAVSTIRCLRMFGEKAVIALPEIKKHYKFQDDGRIEQDCLFDVVEIIKAIKPKSKITVEQILNMMDCDFEPILDASIAAVLRKRGTYDDIAVKLAENSVSANHNIRTAAARKLEEHSKKCVAALPVLAKFSFPEKDIFGYGSVKNAISEILKTVKNDSKVTVDQLMYFLEIGHQDVCLDASDAVARITGSYDRPAKRLAELSGNADEDTRQAALLALNRLAGNAKAGLPILKNIKPIDDNHGHMLERAIEAIETGKEKPNKEVMRERLTPPKPFNPKDIPEGILNVMFPMNMDTHKVYFDKLQVSTYLLNDDNVNERLTKITNWKIEYIDGSKFPEIISIKPDSPKRACNWTLSLKEEMIPEKQARISIIMSDGKFSRWHEFKVPHEYMRHIKGEKAKK